MKKKGNKKMPTPRHKLIHNPIPTSLFLSSPQCISYSQFNVVFSLPNAFITNKQNSEQRCRDEVMNEFVSWCRHLLVSFLFHALTSLHPLHFIEMIFPLVYIYLRGWSATTQLGEWPVLTSLTERSGEFSRTWSST